MPNGASQREPPFPIESTGNNRAKDGVYALLDALPQLIWTARPDGSVDYHNRRWNTYTTEPPERLLGHGWLHWLHPDDRHRTLIAWQYAVRTGSSYEAELRIHNDITGEYRWFLARGVPLKDKQGTIVKWVGYLTDIHEQKQLEEALRVSNARFQRLFESNILGIALADMHGHVWEANDAYLAMTGYTRSDMYHGLARWDTITPPEFRVEDEKAIQETLEQGFCIPYEKVYQQKDGRRIPVIIGVVRLDEADENTICFVMDNTERKELEKRKDEFIGIASHELKTPLAALKMLVSRLKKRIRRQEFEQAETYLDRIDHQIMTLTTFINDLLDVSKIQMGRFAYRDEEVDLDALVQEVVITFQTITPTHALVLHGATHCSLRGDRQRLTQVVANLISNAIKYSPQANKVDITLNTTVNMVTISIQDYGVGIPKEQQDKVFERFNRGCYGTSEQAFPGLGMGLFIVDEIVTHYGGTITIKSAKGAGTTFVVSLPLTLCSSLSREPNGC